MSNKALKQQKGLRDVWLNRMNELKTVAEDAMVDEGFRDQFKLRYADIETIAQEFLNAHLNITSQSAASEGADLLEEEGIRKTFDSNYYRVKEIHLKVFDNRNQVKAEPELRLPSVKLPKIDLPKFSGNMKDWPSFFDLFKVLIHDNAGLSKIEKFQYLVSSLTKNALTCVKSIPLTSDNYEIAFTTLIDRFQNNRLLATAYWQEIADAPKLTSDSAYHLRNLLDCFKENLEGLKNINLPIDSWSFVLFQMLIKKLHPDLIKRFELKYASNDIPSYDALCAFLHTHCVALESANLNSMSRSFFANSKKTTIPSAYSSRDNSVSNRVALMTGTTSRNSCLLCSGSHSLKSCSEFLKKKPFERFRVAKQNILCLNCLEPSHRSINCSMPSGCKKCGSKQHDLLHYIHATNSNNVRINSSHSDPLNDSQAPSISSSSSISLGENNSQAIVSTLSLPPQVGSKPWVLSPDTNTGDLTKLCNHKRKIIAMASLDCKPPDPNVKLRKEYNVKRKKRKIGLPYAGGVSVSQILAHREKLALNQHNLSKDVVGSPQQVWSQQQVNSPQIMPNRLHSYPETPQNHHLVRCQDPQGARVMPGSPVVVGDNNMMLHQSNVPNNISHQPISQNQPIHQANSNTGQINVQSQQIFGPNGQLINIQGPIHPNHTHSVDQMSHSNTGGGMVLQGQNFVQTQQPNQHRIFINGQPNEPSGPGRPNIQMIPVSLSNQQNIVNQQRQDMQQRNQLPPQQQQQHHHIQFYNNQPQYLQPQPYDPSKNIRPFNQVMNGYRPQGLSNNPNNQVVPIPTQVQQQQQKMQWQNRIPQNMNQQQQNQQQQPNQIPMNHPNQPIQQNQSNVYERVPPLHQHTPSPTVWQEEIKRKKIKMGKVLKNRPYHIMDGCPPNHAPCPNIDVRQIPIESRAVIINQLPQNNQSSSSPSFMEDPSGYLAQQTALLNNTINRQTGANGYTGYVCNSPVTSDQNPQQQNVTLSNSQTNEVPLPSNIAMSHIKTHAQNMPNRPNQNMNIVKNQQIPNHIVMSQQYGQLQIQPNVADSSATSEHPQYVSHCQGCIADSIQQNQYAMKEAHQQIQKVQTHSRPNSTPNTPSSSGSVEDPVTSSTYSEKHCNQASPDSRPIQGGTVSTSNVSPVDGLQSDPPTPNPQTPNPHTPNPQTSNPHTPNPHTPNPHTSNPHTPNPHTSAPQRMQDNSQMINSNMPFVVYSQPNQMQQIQQQMNQHARDINSSIHYQNQNIPKQENICCSHVHPSNMQRNPGTIYTSGVVTTMASGRTVGHNTITSVIAGRTNTATVSINSPSSVSGSSTPTSISGQTIPPPIQTQAITVNVSKSPLEMVQSVVSSIQVPHTQQPSGSQQSNSQISPHIIKHSPTGLPPGHILVSSGGQLIMANTGNSQGGVMAPPPPKIMTNQSGMPPISVSPMVTNVTASVTQVIPAVAQQVLGQQTVLVNALPAPFVLQPGVTMTMDGMAVGQNMQLPQLVTGNVIQQQIQIDNSDPRRVPSLLSPDNKKKGKKRKMSSQTVASMLHIAAQQNSGVVMSQQGFPQQIQMAHSPQGITTGPVMQALTIVPSKTGGPPQIVMNGQAMANTNLGTQQLITNSQPAQQINLLQPVNLINGTTGVVQNFPAIQQFILPNLGGMVMNPDGTATILQDTSNIGMQLQIQNVNGQNVLTPVQNNSMFNGGQSILAAGPAGMVIRAPTSQGKIIQQQQHSPGAQFLSPNGGQFVVNGAQFSGQLSPLVASVSPSQQVTFSTSPQQIRPNNNIQAPQQEYIQMNGQMGQTLVVPCTPTGNIAVSSSNQQNTTFVQQNTTIVQQQTTMVANNQQLQNFQQNNPPNSSNVPRAPTMNMDQQNYIISSNDNKQMQAVMVQQRESPQNSANYRQSVSTQTAVNQNAQSVTTNTFCQTSTLSAGSPPDTTTLSPIASGGQSPPTADTTTHSGSTDDGLSPAPSNCSASCSDINVQTRPQSCTMAMVHCISSSEPDSADLNSQSSDNDWRRGHAASTTPKTDYLEVTSGPTYFSKKSTPTHVAFAESSTLVSGLQYLTDQMKAQESVVSSRNYEKMMQHKRKSSDTIVIMESHRMHSSLFDDNDETESGTAKTFTVGDLIWGPAKGCPAWPGKIIDVQEDSVSVKWFGLEKSISKVDIGSLRTLSEGLDAHHQARKKSRTSRKLSTQLEKAIQEAMAELDKQIDGTEKETKEPKPTKLSPKVLAQPVNIKKPSGRLRSSQR